MNMPGMAEGTGGGGSGRDQFRPELIDRLGDLTTLYNRVPKKGDRAWQPSE